MGAMLAAPVAAPWLSGGEVSVGDTLLVFRWEGGGWDLS